MPDTRYGFQTRSIHTFRAPDDPLGALTTPVHMTATYAFDTIADAAAAVAGESGHYIYGRHHNPTQKVLEDRLAALEGTDAAVVMASGMAAISTTLLTLLSAGDEIIVHHTMYTNAMLLLDDTFPRLGIRVKKVDLTDPARLAEAMSADTRIVYFESLVNPTCEALDIRALSRLAHASGALAMVDATFASPALQRPREHGADIVVHSLTKYINGHGDLIGGAVLGEQATMDRIRSAGLKCITGATLSPMQCFLVLRGLKTLTLRMRQHGASALRIAHMLAGHPAVQQVRHPFLPTDPGHPVAKAQMLHGSGMLAFTLHAGFDGAATLIDNLALIKCAVSLGDTESLITQPAALVKGRQKLDPNASLPPGVSMGLIRLSVGLEDVEDLLADLQQALALLPAPR